MCHFGLIKIPIEFELQRRGKTWKEFLIVNQIKEDEQEQQQERTEFMLDIDEEILERKSSNVPQPSNGVRTRRTRQETAKKIEKDKIFTTYKRRSRRIKRNQTQDDQPDLNSKCYENKMKVYQSPHRVRPCVDGTLRKLQMMKSLTHKTLE